MSKPSVKPLGIGDLKVVKQKLARYEAGEIAHIENVMASETRSREHRRLRQVEEVIISEKEREEENVRDLQSTERYEMQNESQKTIKSDTRFEAGLEVSAEFGPVSVSASTKFATSSSKEESDKASTKYAKDVTERTLSKLIEKVREERRIRTLEEFEEKNLHKFENADGGHISGIYRWVDKYYRNKVVDYGRRLMYEFYVPEPAAFYLFSTKNYLENKVLPVKPSEPVNPYTNQPLSPADIDRYNYLTLVRQHNVQGVEPPPPEQIVLAKALSREFQSDGLWAFTNEELKIPKGYAASYGYYTMSYGYTGDPKRDGYIFVGINDIQMGIYTSLDFDNETSVIPISGLGYGVKVMAINIEAVCDLIPEYYKKWQLDTYSAIMNAYHKALMDYEERMAAAQIQQGVQIGGDNPLINREIEKEQLKKSCLTIWTAYPFNNLPGIDHNPTNPVPYNYPEINQSNAIATSERIEFYEKAFDWKNITYEFYPYFWGRKDIWLDTYSLESSDPVFEQFLKAGAAKVVVPVRPSYAEMVLYFQLTGSIWNGGSIPPLASTGDPEAELYNGYLKELEGITEIEDIDRDIDILPDDPEAWLTKVPTELVWLQSDNELPDFEE
jgi:hypothetical protein